MARGLTKKQRGFVHDYLKTGNGTLAALNNYDIEGKDRNNTASVIASENIAKPRIREYLESRAKRAAEIVYELAENAETEQVKLSASKDILDRAGFKAIDKSLNVNVNLDETNNERTRSIADRLIAIHR